MFGFGLALASATPARAAGSLGRTATPAERAAAQALFEQGRALMDQGRAEEACPRFEESDRLDPGLGTQYHLADCYEATGKVASAYALFLEVAAQAHIRGQGRRERLARERAQAVKAKLPRLSIEVPLAQAEHLVVERDGTPVGPAQYGIAIPVDPGLHRVRASGHGFEPWVTELRVGAAPAVHRVRIPPLARAEREASFFAPTSRKVGLATLGISVLSLGVGGAFALQAHSKDEDSRRAGCGRDTCPDPASLALRQEARAAGDRATWATGLGAVGLLTTGILFWALPEWSEDEPGHGQEPQHLGLRLLPSPSARGAALRLETRFH